MANQQKFTVEIPDRFDAQEREEIAEEIINFILDRTEQGIDVRGRPFPEYSEKYVESLDFKNAGKSANQVNLKLSGDMLAALQLLEHDDGTITIGYEEGDDEMNGKVEGNVLGTYGQPDPIPGKKRNFLGITKKDLSAIIRAYGETE